MVTNVPFNYYYTSEMLQKILEKPLEKKAGKNYGPPGSKKLVYFLGWNFCLKLCSKRVKTGM
jgi:dynein heavy chain